MPNLTKGSFASQEVFPVMRDMFLHYLHEASLFAPAFFDLDGKYELFGKGGDMRPRITDISSHVNGIYGKGQTIKVPMALNPLQVYEKIDNVEITDQGFDVSTVDVTVSNIKYVSILHEWGAMPFDNIRAEMRYMEAQAFTNSIGAGEQDTLTLDRLAEVAAIFNENKINTNNRPIYVVVNPRQYSYLAANGLDEYRITGDSSNKTLNSGRILQTPFGIRICQSANIETVNGVAESAAFVEDAIAAYFAIKPTIKKDEDSRKMGKRTNSYYMCGYSKLRDAAGLRLEFDGEPSF